MGKIPGKVSGAWRFVGTSVPVRALFENLKGGATVVDSLEWLAAWTAAAPSRSVDLLRRSNTVFPAPKRDMSRF